jgi:5-formyltetrahydrofolate cyclo-ligase
MDKNEFRILCRDKIKKASRNRLKNSYLVRQKLDFLISRLQPKTILTYLPLQGEVDIDHLNRQLRKRYTLMTPFMQGVSLKSVRYKLPLEVKKFGVLEPPNSNFELYDIDLAIVPVIGVDSHFRRVGFGKGFYDRYFATLKKRPVTVFVQLCRCYEKSPICDAHDITADFYITPKDFVELRDQHVIRNWSRISASSR